MACAPQLQRTPRVGKRHSSLRTGQHPWQLSPRRQERLGRREQAQLDPLQLSTTPELELQSLE